MMMKSIVQLRPALEAIKSDFSKNTDRNYNTEKGLRNSIPSFTDFETVESIMKPLAHVQALSETFSSDQNVTLPHVVPKLYNLHLHLTAMATKTSNSEVTKDFAEAMLANIEAKLPKCGSQNFLYAVGNLLHPFYKGFILNQMGAYQTTLQRFIDDNGNTIEQSLDGGEDVEDSDDNEEVVTAEVLTQRAMKEAKSRHSQSSSQDFASMPFERAITPLQLELSHYMNLNEKDSRLDILGWWKNHSKEFPLLSRAAKKYLCIQVKRVSSCIGLNYCLSLKKQQQLF